MADQEPSPLRRSIGDFAPAIVDYTDDVLFGSVWERPELPKRDRSTHLAFYAGWPKALSGIDVAKKVFSA